MSPAGFVHGFGGSGLWLGFGLVWGFLFFFVVVVLFLFPSVLFFPCGWSLAASILLWAATRAPIAGDYRDERQLLGSIGTGERNAESAWGGFLHPGRVNLTVPAALRWRGAACQEQRGAVGGRVDFQCCWVLHAMALLGAHRCCSQLTLGHSTHSTELHAQLTSPEQLSSRLASLQSLL